MADSIHCIKKTLRLIPEEAKILAEKAEESGINEAAYLRMMIRSKPCDYPEIRDMLKTLINEVNRIGVNINQIVFNYNSEFYSRDDKTNLIAYMKKLNVLVNKVVEHIGDQ